MWLVGAAFAVEPVEEIVVWGDRFARWQRRWAVQTEVRFQQPQIVFATRNSEVSLAGIQIRAVLDCNIDFVLTPGSREVSCMIEDVSLVALPRLNVPTNAAVLDEADASLTGAILQLQVKDKGQVPNVDLEGVPGDDNRGRIRVEQLRQLMSRVILPFHLEMPEPVRTSMRWYEYNSELFRLPTAGTTQVSRNKREITTGGTVGTLGGSMIAHYLDPLDPERFVIQSVGKATVTSPSRTGRLTFDIDGKMEDRTTPTDFIAMEMTGVALVDRATGILAERVWVVRGEVTSSSPNAIYPVGWYHTGRLRMLGQEEHVDVGETWVARALAATDTNPEWITLEP